MLTNISGNNIRISIAANELTTNTVHITLPDGYSYENIHVTLINNIGEIAHLVSVGYDSYTFPPVRSHSPSTFDLFVQDTSKRAEIRILIEKFGQIPDAHYFDKAFEPISVTGDDGNDYNMIPSDQFN
nr:MAG TPA: hypothetical protein [Caudoviricetes sp.]